ncbi:MAG: hypothetical protein KAX39_03660 [candidate division Zixibacteria bacterium]|nr:hypothetical protein [candidate division Zixibacteria bacterium]
MIAKKSDLLREASMAFKSSTDTDLGRKNEIYPEYTKVRGLFSTFCFNGFGVEAVKLKINVTIEKLESRINSTALPSPHRRLKPAATPFFLMHKNRWKVRSSPQGNIPDLQMAGRIERKHRFFSKTINSIRLSKS